MRPFPVEPRKCEPPVAHTGPLPAAPVAVAAPCGGRHATSCQREVP